MGWRWSSSQSHHRDFHHRQNPTSHSRMRRSPATHQRTDRECFVSFSCIFRVVLSRCRTPSAAAIPVVRWIGTSGAQTYSSNRRRAFFVADGIRPLRHVSHPGSQRQTHLGLGGTSRGTIMQINIPIRFNAAVQWSVNIRPRRRRKSAETLRRASSFTTSIPRRAGFAINFRRLLRNSRNNCEA